MKNHANIVNVMTSRVPAVCLRGGGWSRRHACVWQTSYGFVGHVSCVPLAYRHQWSVDRFVRYQIFDISSIWINAYSFFTHLYNSRNAKKIIIYIWNARLLNLFVDIRLQIIYFIFWNRSRFILLTQHIWLRLRTGQCLIACAL